MTLFFSCRVRFYYFCAWINRLTEDELVRSLLNGLPIILAEVLLLRNTMNHCESLSHQLQDARREAQVAARKINRRENVPGYRRREKDRGRKREKERKGEKRESERDGRPCRRMTSERMIGGGGRQASTCSPEDEGRGEHRVAFYIRQTSLLYRRKTARRNNRWQEDATRCFCPWDSASHWDEDSFAK